MSQLNGRSTHSNGPSKRPAFAMAVLGLALVVGALAMRSGDEASNAPSRHETESVGVDATQESPLKNFFGQASARALKAAPKSAQAPLPASASAKVVKENLATKWKQSTARMKFLEHCRTTESCRHFSQDQSFSYGLEVDLAIAAEIKDFTKIALQYKRSSGGDLPEEAQALARYFLTEGNDDVKEAAMRLLKHAKPSALNLKAFSKGMIETGSGRLMEEAMQTALLPYAHTKELDRVLLTQAKIGSSPVQAAVAKHCLDYLNPRNIPAFKAIAARTNPRSVVSSYYKANFAEEIRAQNGG